MPISYSIHQELGLVYVRYDGFTVPSESAEAFAQYLKDPGYRPGHKQLVDLRAVTGFDPVYLDFFELQAKKAEAFLPGPETLIVYLTSNVETQKMAKLIARSWTDIPTVVSSIVSQEQEALSILGIAPEDFEAAVKRNA